MTHMKKEKAERVWVGYIRVSTREQADSGLSLEAQKEKVLSLARGRGVELAEVLTDASESAKDLNRPGMRRILELAQSGRLEGILVAKFDRLTRSMRDFVMLVDLFVKKDVSIVSAYEWIDTGTATGRMMLTFFAMISEWERETISERTSAGLQAKLRRGEPAGNVRYGWRYVGKNEPVVEDEREQIILDAIIAMRKDGVSLREIAAKLNESGHLTRSGKPWQFQYVANVLRMVEKKEAVAQ